jgi:integrase
MAYGGGIYTNEKCFICGSILKDNLRDGLICPDHPKVRATKFRVHFKGVKKRFSSYDDAYGFLITLRGKYKENSFDKRDYSADQPLSFANLANDWLGRRKKEGLKCWNNKKWHLSYAIDFFQHKNIKTIGFAELEDFLTWLPDKLSGKSKYDILCDLKTFFRWSCRRKKVPYPDEWPVVKYKLGWRKTVTKEEQQQVLDEIKRLTYHYNPKIWIGVKWLCTYISIRPDSLMNIKEGDFDFELRGVRLWVNKEEDPRFIPMLDEDLDIVKSFPKALPGVYFFRHHNKRKGVKKSSQRMGRDYLYNKAKEAMKNLGIDGVDLYGLTRHSSARALRKLHTPEEIKRATMHSTNKAFERYFALEMDDVRAIYEGTRGGKKVGKVLSLSNRGKSPKSDS